jgi:GTPase SAR1 family protein
MKDIRWFQDLGKSLAERVAQGKFKKEKVEKTIRLEAKKATSFMPQQTYYSQYALKAFDEHLSELTGKPKASEESFTEETGKWFPEGLSNKSNSNRGRTPIAAVLLQTELENRELRLNYSRPERTSLDERY